MKATDLSKLNALDELIEYAKSGHAYLSERTEYGRGYKDGITRGKDLIIETLTRYGIKF